VPGIPDLTSVGLWRGIDLLMKPVAAVVGASLFALVVAGFIVGAFIDAGGSSSIPGANFLHPVPPLGRLALEILIGVPVAFGLALYAVSQLIELAWLLSWPVRKLAGAVRSQP
jgi:hypothetical protein